VSSHIHIQSFISPAGELMLGSYKDVLCLCDWRFRKRRAAIDKRIQSGLQSGYLEASSFIIEEAKQQLNAYFQGKRQSFDLALKLVGTDFQKEVWEAVRQVPYGRTESYSGLAALLGDQSTIRAVASANAANAISIIVPCHRILGSDGSLVGYAGGLPAKRKLLRLENGLRQYELPFPEGKS